MFQCGAGLRSTIPPSFAPTFFRISRLFCIACSGTAIDDGHWRFSYIDKMAASFRVGSSMLSRVAAPSTCLAKRTFTTSLAFRAGPKIPTDDEAPPAVAPLVRSNPLVGNLPPSPPPADSVTKSPTKSSTESKPNHAYDASKPFSLDIASIIANKSSAYGAEIDSDPIARPQIRAKPVTGRTVFIKDRVTKTTGPTPMVALRVLNRIIREDQVKNKFHSQKFHERKGLKKKRLRSQRWRSRFKHGFKATVSRVMELKKQGW
ncbi:ribosomal S21 [Fusarium phyllophilum]|uniref:Ribosomal S21 n=1 Tax=Fusarium phyllophilum TaxID=47803 RepID=A0A8H5JNQ3_9HYPO|nr:ribosomal S21 [Fusarium phyllophilum]